MWNKEQKTLRVTGDVGDRYLKKKGLPFAEK
jgi:hypothetical protein